VIGQTPGKRSAREPDEVDIDAGRSERVRMVLQTGALAEIPCDDDGGAHGESESSASIT
jgi:hypothetical protein